MEDDTLNEPVLLGFPGPQYARLGLSHKNHSGPPWHSNPSWCWWHDYHDLTVGVRGAPLLLDQLARDLPGQADLREVNHWVATAGVRLVS